MTRPTVNAMATHLLVMWNRLSQEERDRWGLLQCEEEAELIKYHHTLGQSIRNEFGLWGFEWEPEIVDGVDVSPEHPDAISMEVIATLWYHLKEVEEEWNA